MATAVTFGVIADARAIQRRRRMRFAFTVILLVGGSALALALLRGPAEHQVSLRIVASYDGVAPTKAEALHAIRATPGFRRVRSVTPRSTDIVMTPVIYIKGRPRLSIRTTTSPALSVTPRFIVVPTWSELDAVFKTHESPSALAKALQKRLGRGTTVSPATN